MKRERFLGPRPHRRGFPGVHRHRRRSLEGPPSHRRLTGVLREKPLEPAASFTEMTVHEPEPVQGSRQLERRLDIAGALEVVERRSKVVVLGFEAIEPVTRAPKEMREGLLGEPKEPVRLPRLYLRCLARDLEPLGGELADRLQHPVARIECRLALAQQALVEERLERVGVSAGDLLRGLVRAAADEDGEPREEQLLLLGEQVVAPLDRRLSVCCRGSASRSPFERSRRCERRSSSCSAEKTAVRAAASSSASGSSSRRVQSTSTAGEGVKAGSTARARVTKSSPVRLAKRRHPPGLLAADA